MSLPGLLCAAIAVLAVAHKGHLLGKYSKCSAYIPARPRSSAGPKAKKPPVRSQFKKGQSGNPTGRPKGTRNFKTDLKDALAQPDGSFPTIVNDEPPADPAHPRAWLRARQRSRRPAQEFPRGCRGLEGFA